MTAMQVRMRILQGDADRLQIAEVIPEAALLVKEMFNFKGRPRRLRVLA